MYFLFFFIYLDCTYDLKEISQCRDCYRFATERPTKYWYCKPCRPFHELVSFFELKLNYFIEEILTIHIRACNRILVKQYSMKYQSSHVNENADFFFQPQASLSCILSAYYQNLKFIFIFDYYFRLRFGLKLFREGVLCNVQTP